MHTQALPSAVPLNGSSKSASPALPTSPAKRLPIGELLTPEAVAQALDVSPGTLSIWRSTGRYNLPFQKIGRKVRYRRDDVVAWLEKRYRADGAAA